MLSHLTWDSYVALYIAMGIIIAGICVIIEPPEGSDWFQVFAVFLFWPIIIFILLWFLLMNLIAALCDYVDRIMP